MQTPPRFDVVFDVTRHTTGRWSAASAAVPPPRIALAMLPKVVIWAFGLSGLMANCLRSTSIQALASVLNSATRPSSKSDAPGLRRLAAVPATYRRIRPRAKYVYVQSSRAGRYSVYRRNMLSSFRGCGASCPSPKSLLSHGAERLALTGGRASACRVGIRESRQS